MGVIALDSLELEQRQADELGCYESVWGKRDEDGGSCAPTGKPPKTGNGGGSGGSGGKGNPPPKEGGGHGGYTGSPRPPPQSPGGSGGGNGGQGGYGGQNGSGDPPSNGDRPPPTQGPTGQEGASGHDDGAGGVSGHAERTVLISDVILEDRQIDDLGCYESAWGKRDEGSCRPKKDPKGSPGNMPKWDGPTKGSEGPGRVPKWDGPLRPSPNEGPGGQGGQTGQGGQGGQGNQGGQSGQGNQGGQSGQGGQSEQGGSGQMEKWRRQEREATSSIQTSTWYPPELTTLDYPLTTVVTSQSLYVQYDETKTMHFAVTSVIPPGTLVYKPNTVSEVKEKKTPVIAWVVSGIFALIVIAIMVFLIHRRIRHRRYDPRPAHVVILPLVPPPYPGPQLSNGAAEVTFGMEKRPLSFKEDHAMDPFHDRYSVPAYSK